jgi:hypothetical protein
MERATEGAPASRRAFLWPGGGTRPGPRFIATTSHAGGHSGGYGFQEILLDLGPLFGDGGGR